MPNLQRTPEWYAARLGKITASRIGDLMIKKTDSVTRENYLYGLACERLSGIESEFPVSNDMLKGIEREPDARAAYEVSTGVLVIEAPFIDHPTIPMSGASPDGLVEKEGLLECKCPKRETHAKYLRAGVPPAQYHWQMLWQMECTGRSWCDFVSYHPGMPIHMQLLVARFVRDEKRIEDMKKAVIAANDEIEEIVSELSKRYGKGEP